MCAHIQDLASQSFPARRRGKKLRHIFSQDMCLGENTSRPASVNSAAMFADELCAQQGVNHRWKRLLPFSTNKKHLCPSEMRDKGVNNLCGTTLVACATHRPLDGSQ